MIIDHEQPVQNLLVDRERDCKLAASIPFSSIRKRKTVAYELPTDITRTDSPVVRIVVKGAPESILTQC